MTPARDAESGGSIPEMVVGGRVGGAGAEISGQILPPERTSRRRGKREAASE